MEVLASAPRDVRVPCTSHDGLNTQWPVTRDPSKSLLNHSFKGGSEGLLPQERGLLMASDVPAWFFRVNCGLGARSSFMGISSPLLGNWRKTPAAPTGPATPGSRRNGQGGSKIRQKGVGRELRNSKGTEFESPAQ